MARSGRPSQDVNTALALLWRELRRGASTAVVRDRMFGTGRDAIEPGHMDVLDLLQQEAPRRMNDLAAALRVDPSTVTRAIQRMEADGLVERRPARGDGRGVTVVVTENGALRWEAVARRRQAIVEQILASMPDPDRLELVRLLHQFVDSLDRYVADGAPLPS